MMSVSSRTSRQSLNSVLFDTAVFANNPTGGIARYFRDLYAGLAGRRELSVRFWSNPNANPHVLSQVPAVCWNQSNFRIPGLDRFAGVLGRKLNDHLTAWVRRNEVSAMLPGIYHGTSYRGVPRFAASFRKVCTVYDMIHEMRNDVGDPWHDLYVEQKRSAVASADRVICISEWTRGNLLDIYPGLDCHRVKVVRLGVSPFWADNEGVRESGGQAASISARPYFLYVGNRGGYKNWEFAVSAFASCQQLSEFDLVCTGAPFTAKEKVFLHQLRIADRVQSWPNVSDSVLRMLYQNAVALVFPSRDEGFGLPILEAFASGCAVVLSDTEVFHEVAGDAGQYFSVNESESFQAACLQVLDEGVHGVKRRLRVARAAEFTRERMADETFTIYKKLVEE